MSIITYSATLNYSYLKNKTKDQLINLVLQYSNWYNEECERKTPRPTYGIKIVIDKSLPNNVVRIENNEGSKLEEFAI